MPATRPSLQPTRLHATTHPRPPWKHPLRIAIVAPPWLPVPPPSYGGTEAVLDALCRGLAERGHEVLLICAGDSTCPVERVNVGPASLGTEQMHTHTDLAHAVFAHEAANAWSADLVHDHTLTGPWVGEAISSAPVVVTNHGPFAGDLRIAFDRLARLMPVVAISAAQARTAGPTGVAAVIHHGLDLTQLHANHGPGEHALFVGRMSPDKGVHLAIDVARRAEVPLVIAAKMREPDERRYYDAFVAPRLGEDVEFVGEIDRSQRSALLASATCLLNPLQWDEPFGLVAIEALAAGVPVVATPRGAMPEIVIDGTTGYLGDTIDELASAVTRAPMIDRKRCRQDMEERFSMARMALDHERFYRGVIASHRTLWSQQQ